MGVVFETADAELAEELLRRHYGTSVRVRADGRRGVMRLAQAVLTPAVRFEYSRWAVSFTVAAGPLGVLAFGRLAGGRLASWSGGSERRLGPGEVFLAAQPGHRLAVAGTGIRAETAIIDPALLSQVADTQPGRAQRPVQITGYRPVSARAARQWTDTCAYVRDGVLAAPGIAGYPVIAADAARLLAATALAVFPNNALSDPTIEDRRDAHPATVRRAASFIEDNAHRDISLADIAAAAQVTIRAVQLGFARHLHTTPRAYLRRVRLDRARHDLLAADPARHTIAGIAGRWGFPSPSRFAVLYRQAYGVPPSHTIHQNQSAPALPRMPVPRAGPAAGAG
jgi:AraC-like DNA-binding protein